MINNYNDNEWMKQAYLLAKKAAACGEVPVGAILVGPNNVCLGSGYNKVIQKQDPCAHAEILALQEAALKVNNYRLLGAIMYVSLEPCTMCAGALINARVARLVFASRDFNAGAAGSVYNLLQGFPLNHKIQIDEGIMQEECAALLIDFFKDKRKKVQ